MPRARETRITEIQSDLIEPKQKIRAEAANDNVIDLTDVVDERKGYEDKEDKREALAKKLGHITTKERARREGVRVAYKARIAAQQAERNREPSDEVKETLAEVKNLNETPTAVAEALSAVKEVADRQTRKGPPKPNAEQLRKSKALKEKLDQEKIAKINAKTKEIFDAMEESPVRELPPEPTEAQKVASREQSKELAARKRHVEQKNAVLREGFRPYDRKEKDSGMGLTEDEWMKTGERIDRRGRAAARRDAVAKERKQFEEKTTLAARVGGFFRKFFGGGEKKPVVAESIRPNAGISKKPFLSEVIPTPSVEKGKEMEPVSMSSLVEAFNKGPARRFPGLRLREEANDYRDPVVPRVYEIASRLGQRANEARARLDITDIEYNRGVLPAIMALAAELAHNADQARQYKKSPEKLKKAA